MTKVKRQRLAWHREAIGEIARAADDPAWVKRLVAAGGSPAPGFGDILEPALILLEDGQWLAYEAHCRKVAPHDIPDIFIARASDGKWYYTTYHFCIGMLVYYDMDWGGGSAADLNSFREEYALREFNGTAEGCLGTTWPPEEP